MTLAAKSRSLLKPQSKSFLPIFVFASLLLGCINLVAILGLAISVIALVGKPAPRLLEKPTGETTQVALAQSHEPAPEAVQQFVAETLFELYDWRAVLPPESAQDIGAPKPDPGVEISVGNSKLKITRSTWKAGFNIDESFRRELLQDLAKITPKGIFSGQGGYASILPRDVSPPVKLEDGRWKVTYQGILMFFENGDNLGKSIPIRHEVYIKEIPYYEIKEKIPSEPKTEADYDRLSDLQRMLYETQSSGLLIEAMPEIEEVKQEG